MLRFRPDMVLFVAPALLSALMVVALARLGGAKIWLYAQDFVVEGAFATGLPKEGSRIDRAISTSAPMLAERVPQQRIHELRNWANLSVVRLMPEDASPYRAEFGITIRHVALYSGNIVNKQGLELIPDVARKLAHRKDLTFAICGDEPLPARAEGAGRGSRQYPLLPAAADGTPWRSSGSRHAASLAADRRTGAALETDQYAGLGPPRGRHRRSRDCAWPSGSGLRHRHPPGEAGPMAEAIERMLDNGALRAELGTNARERVLDQWDAPRILARFRRAAHELVGASAPGLTKTTSISKASREA